MRVRLVVVLLFMSLSSAVFNKNGDAGSEIFISKKSGVHNKYAILQIIDSIAYLEIYTKYNGEFVPVNMSWNSKIDPEKYVLKSDTSDPSIRHFNGNIITIDVWKDRAEVRLKYTFMGGFDLEFEKVNEVPDRFETVRNHAYMFTGRNAVGYQFKSEGGYESYDRFMKGNVLYKECDQLHFHDFVLRYDSVQKNIFKKIYSVHDSLKIHSANELPTVEQE